MGIEDSITKKINKSQLWDSIVQVSKPLLATKGVAFGN